MLRWNELKGEIKLISALWDAYRPQDDFRRRVVIGISDVGVKEINSNQLLSGRDFRRRSL